MIKEPSKPPCLLVTSWPTDSGIGSGAAAVAANLNKALQRAGYGAEFAAPNFPSGGYFSTSAKRIFFNLGLRNDRRVISHNRIVTFDFDGFYFRPGFRFAAVNGGLLADIVRFESGVVRQAVSFMALLERMTAKKADRIFTPSRYAKKTLCGLYAVPEEKVSVMHNGIFFDEWKNAVDSAPLEEDRPSTVLAVARLYKRKGLDTLIRAWPRVLAHIPGARLRIAGGGLEYENLKKLIDSMRLNESVRLEGDVRQGSDLIKLYANCDVFCLPSRHETFGLVYLEAMAAGKPVVALKSTAVPEVVRDGTDGLLAQPENIEDLAEKIISLLKNGELRATMGRSGRERVRDNFDWPNVITPLTDWLEESC